jgi:hypothetical protein
MFAAPNWLTHQKNKKHIPWGHVGALHKLRIYLKVLFRDKATRIGASHI